MVIIGVPTYNGQVLMDTADAIIRATARNIPRRSAHAQTSILTYAFNQLWVMALNARSEFGCTHFCMLHADISPEAGWLDTMMDVMDEHQADVVSAVSPIKSSDGLTSTAREVGKKWRVKRYTMTEIASMDETFTDEGICINTALMLVDLRKPWVEKVHFRFEDTMVKENGKFVARNIPEDWLFSRDARELGAKLVATRAVKLNHIGQARYGNQGSWGRIKEDVIL